MDVRAMIRAAMFLTGGGLATLVLLATALGPIGPCLGESQSFALLLGLLGLGGGLLVLAFAASRRLVCHFRRKAS